MVKGLLAPKAISLMRQNGLFPFRRCPNVTNFPIEDTGFQVNKVLPHPYPKPATSNPIWHTVALHVVFRGFPHVHTEHHCLGGHRGHLIAEAVLVYAVHVCRECVLSIGLPLASVDHPVVRAQDLKQQGRLVWLRCPTYLPVSSFSMTLFNLLSHTA